MTIFNTKYSLSSSWQHYGYSPRCSWLLQFTFGREETKYGVPIFRWLPPESLVQPRHASSTLHNHECLHQSRSPYKYREIYFEDGTNTGICRCSSRCYTSKSIPTISQVHSNNGSHLKLKDMPLNLSTHLPPMLGVFGSRHFHCQTCQTTHAISSRVAPYCVPTTQTQHTQTLVHDRRGQEPSALMDKT